MAVITFASSPFMSRGEPRELNFGLDQRPALGGPATRITRGGTRFACDFSFPPMAPDTSRPFIARLLQARENGARVTWPLMGVSQGSPGSPVVNGSGATGTSLPVRSANPGYQVKEGYWLNVVKSGVYYLHTCTANTILAAGTGTIPVWPPLRTSLSDGDTVVIDEPLFEGMLTSPVSWPMNTNKIVTLEFTLEEAA